jgi:hypothetical protein
MDDDLNGKCNPYCREMVQSPAGLMDSSRQVVEHFIALIHCTPSALNTASTGSA